MNYCVYCGKSKGVGPCPCEAERKQAEELASWRRALADAEERAATARRHIRALEEA